MFDIYKNLSWDYEKDNLDEFQRKLKKARKKLTSEYDILNAPVHEYDIDSLNEMEEGRFSCTIDGARFECLLQRNQSDQLYVFFNGAIGKNQSIKTYPTFQRWSWFPITNANVLNIFDPMLYDFSQMRLGWYYGDMDRDYRKYMARIILSIAKYLNIDNKKIILYGSSGGGTASFFTSMYIPGSVAVAINPQLRPWKHEWYPQFVELTGIDMTRNDKYHRNDIYYHIDHSPDNKFILLTNCRSRVDFNFQLIPIGEHYGFVNKYGLTRYRNLYSWIFDNKGKPGAHNSVDYPAIFVSIDLFIKKMLGGSSEENLNGYVKLINEFWRDHYEN